MESYASLYEYLGKRAGMDLGQKVFQEAKKQGIKVASKNIKQGGYEGKVMCYPITFLTGYFNAMGVPQTY